MVRIKRQSGLVVSTLVLFELLVQSIRFAERYKHPFGVALLINRQMYSNRVWSIASWYKHPLRIVLPRCAVDSQ